jgi:LuxR family maltose regulon positive regulatory protein
LLVVSVCSPLPVGLAAELSGRPDAARILDELSRETSLLEPIAGGRYRIHELLRSYLVADLARHWAPTFRNLQVRAARWWSEDGDAVHALRHAERAADKKVLADLLHRSGLALLLAGELGGLRRGLAAIGPTARQKDPWLALLAMITHLDARSLPEALADLQAARRAWPEAPEPALDALLASTELLTIGLGAIDPPASPFPAVNGDTAPEIEALLRASRGMAVINEGSEAELELARTDLERAVELARNLDLGYLEVQSLTALASLAWIQRDHRAMPALAEQAVAVAVRHGHGKHPSTWSSYALGMLAYADLMGGDPEAAFTRTTEALSAWGPLPPEAAYTLHAVHGAGQADLGERGVGLAEIRAARGDFADRVTSATMRASLALLEHRVALMHGNPVAAAEVADWLNGWVGETAETELMRAWADTAAGRYESARDLAARIDAGSLAVALAETSVEAHLLGSEALLRDGDEREAAAALDRALAEGEAIGAARPFALAGPLTRQLLLSRPATNGQAPFARRLAAARAAVTPDAAALLSERETAVLALLPTLLDAAEIGAEFTVSVNTVKSHIRSIYAKLGVSSRREAVLRARDRGLLP